MKVTIRKASVNEAVVVAEIGRATFYETWKSVNTEEDLQIYMSKAFDPEMLNREIENESVNTFLLVFADEVPAGYAKLRNDRLYEQLKGTRSLELERIYVFKHYQNKKVGKALMDECIRVGEAGLYDWIWLGVNQENFKAIDFYKRYGFEVFGTKQFVLGTAIDEDFLMKRRMRVASRVN